MQELSVNPKTMIKARRSFAYYLEVVAQILRPLMGPALALAAVVLGASAGMLATKLSLTMVLMMLGGAAIVLFALSRPEFVILLMLVISSSIIDPQSIPTINVGFNFRAVEMCLLFLLGLVVVRALSDKEDGFVRTPLNWPVFLFFVAATLSFFNAIYNLGTPRGLLVRLLRTLFDYLMFFAVTNLVRTRRQLMTLVHSMFVMTTIMAALMVIQGVVGPSVRVMPSARVLTAGALGQEFVGVTRVLPPGVPLVFIMLFPALILHATPEYLQTRKWLSLVPLLLLPVAIAFTFNRTWWMGTVLSLIILLFIMAAGQRKYIFIAICVIVVLLFISTCFLEVYVPRTGNLIEALSFRAGSLFTGDRIKQDQERRTCEVRSAIATLQDHPLLGVGPGGIIHTRMCADMLTRYVHNAYLFILADLGLLGFLPFLWFSASYLFRGFSVGRTLKDPILRSWVLGLTLGYITTLVAAIAGPEFMAWHTVPIVGVMLGVNEVAIRLGQQSA
jgi:O-antigen ligase